MKLKSFSEYIKEDENVDAPVAAPSSVDDTRDETKKKFRTKKELLGYTSESEPVMAVIKVGHTIELTPDDFKQLKNLKVTQYESDMYEHVRGGKVYKIKKDGKGKYVIFHYHKTLHKLTPVGTFRLE